MKKNCLICQKEFKTFPCKIKAGNGKYCSRKCHGISMEGNGNYMWGKFNEESPQWIGNKVRYYGLHKWIRRVYGKLQECVYCGKKRDEIRIEMANVSGKYTRNYEDWIPLCRPCHIAYDRKNGWGKTALLFPETKTKGGMIYE